MFGGNGLVLVYMLREERRCGGFWLVGVLKVGVSFIQETTVMNTRVVSGEVGHGTSEG